MSVEGVKDRKVVERRWARARPSGAYQPVGGTGLLLEGNGSNWGSFASTGHLAMLGDILGSHNLQKVGRGVLLAYSRMRPRMLLNIVQCPGQSPRQRMSQSQMLIVPRLREPGPKAGGGQQRVQSKAMIQAELRGENGAQGVRVEAASLGPVVLRFSAKCSGVANVSEPIRKLITFLIIPFSLKLKERRAN